MGKRNPSAFFQKKREQKESEKFHKTWRILKYFLPYPLSPFPLPPPISMIYKDHAAALGVVSCFTGTGNPALISLWNCPEELKLSAEGVGVWRGSNAVGHAASWGVNYQISCPEPDELNQKVSSFPSSFSSSLSSSPPPALPPPPPRNERLRPEHTIHPTNLWRIYPAALALASALAIQIHSTAPFPTSSH